GEAEDDAVVGPDDLDLLAEARLDEERPGRVDAGAERGEQAHAPVAELVAEALDGEAVVGGQRADRLLLVGEVADQVRGGALVEPVLPLQPRGRGVAARRHLADEGAESAPELDRPPRPLAAPERKLAGLAGRGLNDDAVARDLLDLPRRRAEEEG